MAPSGDSDKPTQNLPQSSLYPSVDDSNIPISDSSIPIEHLDDDDRNNPTVTESSEDVILRIPNSIVHLIDKTQSVELASGDLEIIRLLQNGAVVAVFARIGDQIQWPLAKDEASVKLDESHYFFTLSVPSGPGEEGTEITRPESMLNYGLTIQLKEKREEVLALLEVFDRVLGEFSSFSVERVSDEAEIWWKKEEREVDGKGAEGEAAAAAAYWTTLAPNVEDYSSGVARMIASGSGKVVKGILWCGDVTVDRLRWGNEFLKRRMGKKEVSEVTPEAMARIERVKGVTRRCEEIANGVLSGVIKVTGYITSSIVNSRVGKKFFSLIPGEIILASLDGFNKVCDAVEHAGKNVLTTSSTVTTELVSERYGEHAARATNEGLGAAGHAIGTAWAVFKIRKAINPKSVVKPTSLAKAGTASTASTATAAATEGSLNSDGKNQKQA